jgi:hypothetical protein
MSFLGKRLTGGNAGRLRYGTQPVLPVRIFLGKARVQRTFLFCHPAAVLVGSPVMKYGMRFGDLLDLEWFLEQDRQADPGETLKRDRRLGLEAQGQSVDPAEFPAFWLERRRTASDGILPSGILAPGLAALRIALCVAGFLAGVSLVRGLLLYSGTDPVNVSVFLFLAVLPQAVLCLLAAFLLAARAAGLGRFHVPFRPLFSLLWRRPGRLSPQTGFLRSMLLGHGWPARMLAWESLRMLQLGGVSLAAGSLAGLLVGVTVTDLAFGWQSTLQVGAAGMHALVGFVAAPWSWLPDRWGLMPTLAQIEGSRIVLKEGITSLASTDLVAWWPFLAMCLLTYALLPRLALLAIAHRGLRRLERGFVHPALGRIADRMNSPLIETPAQAEPEPSRLPLDRGRAVTPEEDPELFDADERAGVVLILPPELHERVDAADLAALALKVGGRKPVRIEPAELETGEFERVLADCAGLAWTGDRERYVLLAEAWQPPILEVLRAIEALGRNGDRSLTLVLSGRPSRGRWLTAPDDGDRAVWSEAVSYLAPLHLEIFGADA